MCFSSGGGGGSSKKAAPAPAAPAAPPIESRYPNNARAMEAENAMRGDRTLGSGPNRAQGNTAADMNATGTAATKGNSTKSSAGRTLGSGMQRTRGVV